MVDVDHRPGALVAVCLYPCRNGRDCLVRELIAALEGAARIGHGRERSELHVLRVGVVPLYGLLRLDVNVDLLVLPVMEGHAAQAGVGGDEVHPCCLLAQHAPNHSFGLVAGDSHAHAGGVTLRQSSYTYGVIHVSFLSQPLSGCVQKPQLFLGVARKGAQLRLPYGVEAV